MFKWQNGVTLRATNVEVLLVMHFGAFQAHQHTSHFRGLPSLLSMMVGTHRKYTLATGVKLLRTTNIAAVGLIPHEFLVPTVPNL